MADAGGKQRDWRLTVLAVAMGLLAFSNLTKPISQHFRPESSVGFVLLGHRLHGVVNAVVGPLFGVWLAVYAYGVWMMRRWVLPLAIAYAVYVPVNLVLFAVVEPESAVLGFLLVYCPIAIGITAGGAYALVRSKDRLA